MENTCNPIQATTETVAPRRMDASNMLKPPYLEGERSGLLKVPLPSNTCTVEEFKLLLFFIAVAVIGGLCFQQIEIGRQG